MYNLLKFIKLLFEFFRCCPHLIVFYLQKDQYYIRSDIKVWLSMNKKNYNISIGLVYLLGFMKEFRNLYYHRIGNIKYILNIFCPKDRILLIDKKCKIGEGLFILHGYATAIGAKSIGKNCLISQNVTIGNYKDGCPTILDNVKIYAGAVVIGNITIGNNVIIGANAIVNQDIPDNCTVYPAPSKKVFWGKKNEISNIEGNLLE